MRGSRDFKLAGISRVPWRVSLHRALKALGALYLSSFTVPVAVETRVVDSGGDLPDCTGIAVARSRLRNLQIAFRVRHNCTYPYPALRAKANMHLSNFNGPLAPSNCCVTRHEKALTLSEA
jgi:hypothetical protein